MPRTVSTCASVLLSCLIVGTASALRLSTSYEEGPFQFDNNADLYYTIDKQGQTASLAVVVNDSDVITSSFNWLGIGLSEPTAGSMLGADVVTAEFSAGETDSCTLRDRYVPFYAYPLIDTVGDAESAFPLPDDCQDDGSWTLVSCMRSEEDGQMIFEVKRSLAAHDSQDREIPPGANSVIYAYGASFGYHGSRRSSLRLILYEDDDDEPVGVAENPLPDDADGSILVTATGYEVPSDKATTYACTSKVLSLNPGEKRMIVAAEPVLNATDDAMVHHLTFWLCRGEEYAKMTRNTVECTTGGSEVPGPQGSQVAQCATFVYAYVKGMKRLVLPREAGILIDERDYIFVMETHYDNPARVQGNIDFSGVKVYYTNTMREHEAGSLLMGDILISRFNQTVRNNFEYEFSCTSACTSKFSRPVNYYASFLHMHLTGKEIYNNRFSQNGTFVETMNKVNFWSDSFQNYIVFDPPKQIKPGDKMQVTCLYDTRKRPNTRFGLETTDEMCMEFAGYWPVQRDPVTNEKINVCAYFEQDEMVSTLCGDLGNLTDSVFIPEPNPAFNDTIGAPTDFGQPLPTCSAVQPLVPSETIESVTAPPLEVTEPPLAEPSPAEPSPAGTSQGAQSSVQPSPVGTSGTTIGSPTTDDTVEGATSPDDGDGGDDDDDDDDVCFPSSATVQLRDGSKKRMDELQIGDSVLVGAGEYSEVFLFTHRTSHVRYRFVQLTTVSGTRVKLTSGHFLYLNGKLAMAGTAREGDEVILGTGDTETVSKVRTVNDKGLYNPQTIHGNIVVDGVVSSTYTQTIAPMMAHGLLAPLRVLHMCLGKFGLVPRSA